ncbi:MarR family winged helix-turn-helix transcriptional regulator [Clostridium brassicae]|uniref:MarR family winged helix-turn-helix transcriptional regulator n=1 Tax=Clostridium brassicae TaxID=2999072 RepID=A0ABT4D894_9CLOT|nr:MarR family winged helix-turn-helix transcriptional regulator [Clostridium brassicae]MCY6958511.1 MarR family winged helix-turn-helix transcriptional regulator [Clostridium brassicae]
MELEWMRKYRNFVEKIIKFGNSYAQSYKTEYNYNTPIKFSASQLQVVEYILENEENHQNMSEIASRLGISPSAFSKNINKMVKKGLLEKFHTSDNRKDVIIKVSDFGKEIYKIYSEYAYETSLKKMFEILDEIPDEYISKFTEVLELSAEMTHLDKNQPEEVKLIKIE